MDGFFQAVPILRINPDFGSNLFRDVRAVLFLVVLQFMLIRGLNVPLQTQKMPVPKILKEKIP